MDRTFETEYWIPEHVREYLRSPGFAFPLGHGGHTGMWREWMQPAHDFYDYRGPDGLGRIYEALAPLPAPLGIALASKRPCWQKKAPLP